MMHLHVLTTLSLFGTPDFLQVESHYRFQNAIQQLNLLFAQHLKTIVISSNHVQAIIVAEKYSTLAVNNMTADCFLLHKDVTTNPTMNMYPVVDVCVD